MAETIDHLQMQTYTYRACNKTGKIINGTMRAADSDSVYEQLENEELVPVYIRLETIRLDAGKVEKQEKHAPRLFGGRIKDHELIVFTRQLSTMLKAGMPILRAVEVLREQTENETFKKVLTGVCRTIGGGSSLSEALSAFPNVFSSQYINIVYSGETGGTLDNVLLNIAEWMERELEVRTEIKSALRYPCMVFVALVAVGILMVIFVIPRFAGFFTRGDVELPLPTKMMVAGNTLIQHYWPAIIGVIIVVGLSIFFLLKNPLIRLQFDKLKFQLPIMGPLYSKIMISRFSRVFAMLVKNGISVLKALDICPSVVPNTYFRTAIRDARQQIQGGSSIFDGFKRLTIIPPIMSNLVAIGEETGKLDEMLDYVVIQYDMDIKYSLKNLTGMIEPVITVVMGVVVLFLALAVFLPIWNMSQVVGR